MSPCEGIQYTYLFNAYAAQQAEQYKHELNNMQKSSEMNATKMMQGPFSLILTPIVTVTAHCIVKFTKKFVSYFYLD